MRQLSYGEAISEAMVMALRENPKLFLMGEGIDDPKGAFGTTLAAYQEFGRDRVMDTPLSENAVAGIGIGAAIEGHPCVMIHMRAEFMILALDQIVNHAAKWHYMFDGLMKVPVVFRCIIGRGWGQAAQHAQSFHNLYAQFPGLKVILPTFPADAKGLLLSAVTDNNPVICLEHRWLYQKTGEVPEPLYRTPIGKANYVTEGNDITCVTLSYGVFEALEAREKLLQEGISLEIIDLRSVRPLDMGTILSSLQKTGRLIIVDISHSFLGIGSEIAAQVASDALDYLKTPIKRIGLPDYPVPCSAPLEASYYPGAEEICAVVRELVLPSRCEERERRSNPVLTGDCFAYGSQRQKEFTGPF